MQRTMRLLMPALLAMLVACDDPPPPAPPPSAPGAPPPGAPPPPSQAAPAPQPRLELTDVDFLEGPNNRDPFRSFLAEFKTSGARRTIVQRKVILPRYGLDELNLIAVVTGRAVRPRAMFRDPSGLGVTVKRGDRISKSNAKIKRILRDSVVVEVEERSEDTQQAAERVIELHPKEEREKEAREAGDQAYATEPAQAEKLSSE